MGFSAGTNPDCIEEAIDELVSSEDWAMRADWQALAPGDTTENPVVFTNERGWVGLEVSLIRLNDSWLVGSYESCALLDDGD